MTRTRAQQMPLDDTSGESRLPTVRCTDCKRKLVDPVSRSRRRGPECDPERRGGRHDRHQVEQDTLPGIED